MIFNLEFFFDRCCTFSLSFYILINIDSLGSGQYGSSKSPTIINWGSLLRSFGILKKFRHWSYVAIAISVLSGLGMLSKMAYNE